MHDAPLKRNQAPRATLSGNHPVHARTHSAIHREYPILHLQRTIGNQAVLRLMRSAAEGKEAVEGGDAVSARALSLVQRQETGAEPMAPSPHPEWVVLKPPPVIQQGGLTCWAAALSSWLGARGTATVSVQDIIFRYAGTACIEPDNSLPYATAIEVHAEWGVTFTRFANATALTGEKVRSLLREHGHLIFAQVGGSLGHALVVYGSGFDDKRQPNPDFVSVMDPLTGKYENRSLAGLIYPIQVGTAASRWVRPAPCLSRPGTVPPP